jgi:hypothetical protein
VQRFSNFASDSRLFATCFGLACFGRRHTSNVALSPSTFQDCDLSRCACLTGGFHIEPALQTRLPLKHLVQRSYHLLLSAQTQTSSDSVFASRQSPIISLTARNVVDTDGTSEEF